MERKFEFEVGEYYHIYARGVEKRIIFSSKSDYWRFITLLFVGNSKKPIDYSTIVNVPWEVIERGPNLTDIGAYCLMPNHFHLLLREKMEKGISRFMSKLLTAYSSYFNKKYERRGRLFESTFNAKYVDRDTYLQHLFSYIHLNPTKIVDPGWKERGVANILMVEKYLNQYSFSSHLDYLGQPRFQSLIINRSEFPEYFPTPRDYSNYILDCLSLPPLLED